MGVRDEPRRYRMLRRLALAPAGIESGLSLPQAAAEAGFADQSHMTRQIKRTYGLAPGRWMSLSAASSQETSRGRRAVRVRWDAFVSRLLPGRSRSGSR